MNYLLGALGIVVSACACSSAAPSPTTLVSNDAMSKKLDWSLTWSDEFDLPNGSPVDPAKWNHEVGGDGWGNEERQYYTDGSDNAVIQDGALVITATASGASTYSCWYGPCRYTSARLVTKGKFTQRYGRLEARIRAPAGQGMWPAFWLLGDNDDSAGWPQCGEIDIMENVGNEPNNVYGTLHGEGYSNEGGLSASYTVPGAPLADDFHVFAVEWEAAAIRFYADGILYSTRTPADIPAGKKWAYDHPFYMLLNLAVGGTWPGDPDATTKLPQTMRVDWVRVYQ